MKEMFHALTEDDRDLICNWCFSYGGSFPIDLEEVLKTWYLNKQELFNLFGKKLRISIPLEQTDPIYFYQKLSDVYLPAVINSYSDFLEWELYHLPTHPFIEKFLHLLGENFHQGICTKEDFKTVSKYLQYSTILSNRIPSPHTFINKEHKTFTIQKNMKTMRAIRKLCDFFGFYSLKDDFLSWRDSISFALTEKSSPKEVILSIHPLDFLTMSDNNCNWSSCVSWQYSEINAPRGTIEMMNSPFSAVAYIENRDKEYVFCGKNIPNKSWRSLVFLDENFLVVGRNYPYRNEIVEDQLIQSLKERCFDYGWKYDFFSRSKETPFKITGFMYDDFSALEEEYEYKYFINCNDTKYDVGGPCTCMRCGQETENFSNNLKGVCEKCVQENYCFSCCRFKDDFLEKNFIDLKSHELKSYTKKICSECWQKETLVEEETGFCIEKNDLLRLRRKHLLPHISERTFLRTKKE